MKILEISHYFSSHKGGVEAVSGALAREFAHREHDVTWMAGDPGSEPVNEGGVRIVPFPISNFIESWTGVPFPIPSISGVRTILREVRRADVVFLQDCLYVANTLAYCAAKLRRIPIIIVQHTRFVPTGPALLDFVWKLATVFVAHPMLSHAEQVVFVAKTTMDTYAHLRFRTPPEIIYCGINTNLFRPLNKSESVSTIRSKYGLPEERPIALFVGRFVRKKGLLAIRQMAALRPDLVWLLAGWGPIDPGEWGLDNVIARSGMDDPSIADFYRCCDLFVLPSVGEGGLPSAVREALVSGLPVVCGEETRGMDPGLAMFVTGAEVFFGDDERTAQGFLRVIEGLLNSIKEEGEKGEWQAVTSSQLSWETPVKRYLEIASRLVPSASANTVESNRVAGEGH